MDSMESFYRNKAEELVNLSPHAGVRMFVMTDGAITEEMPLFGCLANEVSRVPVPDSGTGIVVRYREERIDMDSVAALRIDDFHEKRQDPHWMATLKSTVMSSFLEERQKRTGDKFAPA